MKKSSLKPRKTKLRKVSKRPLRLLILEADKLLQDYYRHKFPQERCEVCGWLAQLRHHFIEKSRSSYLRYNEVNLIPLCSKCHFKYHRTGDPEIVATILEKRGKEWFKVIQRWRRETLIFTRKIIEEIIKRFTQ